MRRLFTRWTLLTAVSALAAVGCAGPTGPAGANGAPCAVTDNGNGTVTITCPGSDPVTLASGTNGTNGTNGTSCTVSSNPDAGTKTISCTDGTSVTVTDGRNGTAGQPGTAADGVQITRFHGIDAIAAEAAAVSQKSYAKLTITSATADAAGAVTVNFDLKDAKNAPIATLAAVQANVARLMPAAGADRSSYWVSYINTIQTVTDGGGLWPAPAGTWAYQGSRENNGTLTNNNNGTYTYVFRTNLATAALPDGGAAIAYERNRTHRVSLMIGGRTGPTASAAFDFVPDGTSTGEKRDIVETATCQQCHGPYFAAHGGDRMTVENCATCHNPGTTDPHSGNTVDFKVMIHKIHAGGELASIRGADGIVWDNPATTADESADNGEYSIFGFGNTKFEWWKVEFPAIVENCTKCHTGSGSKVDNWKTNPTRATCGSCHDDVNFATGTNHPGGQHTDDAACTSCHPATGTPTAIIAPIIESHDWVAHDVRNQPEFNVTLSVSAPANGQYFTGTEQPKVTFSLAPVGGGAIDHTTLDAGATAVGCGGMLPDGGQDGTCATAADGFLSSANFFVHGPRARQNPVLTTTARAEIIAPTSGPWTVATGSLILKVDNGEDIRTTLPNGQDVLAPSTITVNVPTGGLNAADQNAVMVWLNGNTAFSRRALAYIDEVTGRLAIRSRNLGKFFAVQLQTSTVATAVFNGDTAMKIIGTSTASNNIITDFKATKFADRIEYTLDSVADLKPGTYIAQAEIGDRGRVNAENYKTPSVKWVTFQVKQADPEKPIAANCNSCHQASNGNGFVLDWSRHNKKFGNDAIDQCSGCHDYQVQSGVGGWSGAAAITRRVHAVHRGSHLNYPLLTVGYANGDPVAGRNWDIEFPQDIRNCQTCHPDTTTSGTWKTNANRLACGGCHDSDAAVAHLRAMTFDPTPNDQFSGDEQESCNVCHAVR